MMLWYLNSYSYLILIFNFNDLFNILIFYFEYIAITTNTLAQNFSSQTETQTTEIHNIIKDDEKSTGNYKIFFLCFQKYIFYVV